jgi:hypothetical protein
LTTLAPTGSSVSGDARAEIISANADGTVSAFPITYRRTAPIGDRLVDLRNLACRARGISGTGYNPAKEDVTMGFLLRILEEDGAIVEEVVADVNFNPVQTGFKSTDFPMMGTLDPYGDTSFNYLQCELLEGEIPSASKRLEDRGVSSEFIEDLVRLCRVGRARPQRRFVFIGD